MGATTSIAVASHTCPLDSGIESRSKLSVRFFLPAKPRDRNSMLMRFFQLLARLSCLITLPDWVVVPSGLLLALELRKIRVYRHYEQIRPFLPFCFRRFYPYNLALPPMLTNRLQLSSRPSLLILAAPCLRVTSTAEC